jgi:hypothetical protein
MLLDGVGRRLARWLNTPRDVARAPRTSAPGAVARVLRPGDVLLVEGSSRISTAIKYLTQSSWSHAALCIAAPDPTAPPEQAPAVLLEADVSEGVRVVPLQRYGDLHTRICRPIGLSTTDTTRLVRLALDRVGHQYDMKNIFDLARYLLPTPPVPTQYRRQLLTFGSGDPTRAICSSLLAEAFQTIGYPILPEPLEAANGRARLQATHPSLITPRDFDVSPYFAIVKPTLELGFDPYQIELVPPPPRPRVSPTTES